MKEHICMAGFTHLDGMKSFYDLVGVIPTSEIADVALIRSHIAYWAGAKKAEAASIRASRGHSYRVAMWGHHDHSDLIVRIVDHYDHREGVTGFRVEVNHEN